MTWRLRIAAPATFLLGTFSGEALWAQEPPRAPTLPSAPSAAAAAPGPMAFVLPSASPTDSSLALQGAAGPLPGSPGGAAAANGASPDGAATNEAATNGEAGGGTASNENTAAPTTAELAPWWNDQVTRPLDPDRNPLTLELESSVLGMLMFSPQVRIAADFPMARRTQIIDAASRFDPRAFVDSKFQDTSDPVGNLLTTGGASRFIDQTFTSTQGLRKIFTTGGQLEASQKFGYQDNNSNFFIPKNQGTAKFMLTYTQPLLNGNGRMYNTSIVYLADLTAQTADAQLIRDLQLMLIDLHKAYWDLRLQRAVRLQRARLKQSAIDIQNELRGRADFDVLQSQLVRANAAVATRDAGVIRFSTEVSNAETRLRALINDPALISPAVELIPVQTPFHEGAETDLVGSLTVALENRPEIKQGFAEVRAAGVRADVSKNELLPVFNLLLGTYVYGLQGDTKLGDAWVQQFTKGRPTYWTGVQFEYPLFNRGANARLTQRRIELRQATNRLNQTMIQVRAETETAVREVNTTYREMVSRYQAMRADRAEIDYLTSRWRLAADDQQIAGVVLNDLLGAQERLAQAEFDFASAEAAYNVALVNLNAVTGTLLTAEGVQFQPTTINGVPALQISASSPYADQPSATSVPAPQPWQQPGAQPAPTQPPMMRQLGPQPPNPGAPPTPSGGSAGQTTMMSGPGGSSGPMPAPAGRAGAPADPALDLTVPYSVVPIQTTGTAASSEPGAALPLLPGSAAPPSANPPPATTGLPQFPTQR